MKQVWLMIPEEAGEVDLSKTTVLSTAPTRERVEHETKHINVDVPPLPDGKPRIWINVIGPLTVVDVLEVQ